MVGRLQVAAQSLRIPSFWSSVARQEVGKGKGVDNLFLQGEVLYIYIYIERERERETAFRLL